MPDDRQQWEPVFAQELEQVTRRRPGDPPVKEHLVGLAFSGGGIRSATFGLGVLERLKSLNLLGRVDYLSTVSGGGYIGAWLSANCKRTADRKVRNPAVVDWLDPQADWLTSIGHLRRYSNYLSPKVGFFSADTWSMVAIWIRNTLLVQLTVILGIAALLLLPRPLVQGFEAWPKTGDLRWVGVALFVLAIAGIAGNQQGLGRERAVRMLQASSWKAGVLRTILCLGLAQLVARHWHFAPFTTEPTYYGTAFFVSLLLLLAGYFAMPVALKVLGTVWPGYKPKQINYGQGWVQGLVVVPLMAVGYFVAAVMWGQSTDPTHPLSRIEKYGDFFQQAVGYWQLPLSAAFASLWLLSAVAIRRVNAFGVAVAILAPIPAVLVLHALLSGIMVLLHGWAAEHSDAGTWRAFVWAPPLVLYAFALTVNILIGMLGRHSSESVREWWSRLGAWLAIYGVAWMTITIAAIYGPLWTVALLDTHWSLAAIGSWLGTTIAGLLAGNSGATSGEVGADGVKPRTTVQKIVGVVALVGPFVFIAGLLVAIAAALYFVILNNSVETLPAVSDLHANGGYWRYLSQAAVEGSGLPVSRVVWAMIGGTTLATLVLAWRVDINEFSLNAFYRSRLGRCYLGAARYLRGERLPQSFTGFDEKDDLNMADLAGTKDRPAAGPLHLINCALNLGGSSDLALHTRHSASFTISPYATGTSYLSSALAETGQPAIGYIPTAAYGGAHGQPTLGQAISVSGAAASPNMGYHTSAVVAFLLTLFNVRLGWWFANPRGTAIASPSPWFSLRYLLKELFGVADDTSNFLMISDGGHFENLAAYELVRRKCRVIIISDAECDPDLHFEGLGTLIRMCEVDFGARIVIKLDEVRREAGAPWSTSSVAIGTIIYGGGAPNGVLIYLKAAITQGEDADVLQYKSSHPKFPHESTGDQFYGDDQFESYRRLGRAIAGRAFGSSPLQPPRTLETLALELLER